MPTDSCINPLKFEFHTPPVKDSLQVSCRGSVIFKGIDMLGPVAKFHAQTDWARPDTLKLPSATILEMYKYFMSERQCLACITYLQILIISIHIRTSCIG